MLICFVGISQVLLFCMNHFQILALKEKKLGVAGVYLNICISCFNLLFSCDNLQPSLKTSGDYRNSVL